MLKKNKGQMQLLSCHPDAQGICLEMLRLTGVMEIFKKANSKYDGLGVPLFSLMIFYSICCLQHLPADPSLRSG
ncbi:MAG TPA: hypothetical protein VLR49_14305 [Ferruginibacter sp.]|nr:hypothetical protein [Ferruginibacter sp.]